MPYENHQMLYNRDDTYQYGFQRWSEKKIYG